MQPSLPPRIHVILARESSKAIVLCRKTRKSTCTLLWDREADSFQLGQWFKGRIDEFISDLSPDGKLFIYFAYNGKWHQEAKGSWTAISKTPYLKAISIWPKGDKQNGGGRFIGSRSVEIFDGPGFAQHGAPLRLNRRIEVRHLRGHIAENPYHSRLCRDGWSEGQQEKVRGGIATIFEKSLRSGWRLRKTLYSAQSDKPGEPNEREIHELSTPSGETVDLPDSQWADYDGQRLLWAARGRIHTWTFTSDGSWSEQELYDFNDLEFGAIEAPY